MSDIFDQVFSDFLVIMLVFSAVVEVFPIKLLLCAYLFTFFCFSLLIAIICYLEYCIGNDNELELKHDTNFEKQIRNIIVKTN